MQTPCHHKELAKKAELNGTICVKIYFNSLENGYESKRKYYYSINKDKNFRKKKLDGQNS
jgi:hypothetical protein